MQSVTLSDLMHLPSVDVIAFTLSTEAVNNYLKIPKKMLDINKENIYNNKNLFALHLSYSTN